jgi:hypothetical protein
MKIPVPFLLLAVLLAGCTTVVKYDARTAAGVARPADYPICVYTEEKECPRAAEVIGTARVGGTPLTMTGGSLEAVMRKMMRHARQQGADAIQVTSVESPGFANSHYRVEANFLRFTDVWETVPLSEAGLLEYLKSHQPALDPIEGIWSGDDQAKSRIGIMRNISRPGRDFVGFILGTKNLSWQNGYKKLDIKQGERRAVYRFDYYLDDFQAKADAMTLGGPAARRFRVHLSDDAEVISFTRE